MAQMMSPIAATANPAALNTYAAQQLANATSLSEKKKLIAYFISEYFNQPLTKLSLAALGRMVPGIAGYINLPNGVAAGTEFCGAASVAYSGMTRIGQDVFSSSMTPNQMVQSLQDAWLPEMLDTDPVRLMFPVLGGAFINSVEVADYDPNAFATSLVFGGTAISDERRVLVSTGVESLPILGYRLYVKAIDNHVGDARVTLTAWDTSKETVSADDLIYKMTLQMGVTAVSDFTGLITVIPLKKTGLVNLNGDVTLNPETGVRNFTGATAQRLQTYEAILNDARHDDHRGIVSDFGLAISGSNVHVYLMPIYPLKSDYEALVALIEKGRMDAYVSYLHLLANTQV